MNLRSLVCGLAASVPVLAGAQTHTYSLPMTTVTVEVDAVQESFFAGPYAPFAKKLLGIDVPQQDSFQTFVKEVRLLTRAEADPQARYTLDAKGETDRIFVLSSQGLVAFREREEAEDLVWRFDPQPRADFGTVALTPQSRTEVRTTWQVVRTDTSFTRVPVQESVLSEKTPEMKAKEAADLILRARKERFNIATGNTDATFSGEALGAALAELERVEKEYLTLFTGYSVEREHHGSFDVVPSVSAREQEYPAFRLSDREGLAADGAGTLYTLVFDPVEVSEGSHSGRTSGKNVVRYRIPAVCRVSLCAEGKTICTGRFPVYQLGRECMYPLK